MRVFNQSIVNFFMFMYGEKFMDNGLKKFLIAICILGGLLLAGYGAYQGYLYLVEDATARVKKGVSEGMGKGVGDKLNPFKWGKNKD